MSTTLLFVLLFFCRTSAHSRASVIVTPNRAQYFEYEEFTLTCQHSGSGEWTVWRYTTDGLKLSQCGSGWGSLTTSSCSMKTVKRSTTGVYWCESEYRDSSNTVTITVTDKPVILESPVLPVIEGQDVNLKCRRKNDSSYPPVKFYKDGFYIRTLRESTGQMTIHSFSKSDEGAYKCSIDGHGESPSSWLWMKDDPVPVVLTASPDTSQWFEYENLTLNCSNNSSFHGWIIKRFTTSSGKMSSCGEEWGATTPSGCFIQTAKQSDSAVYWCESPARQRSNSANITIYNAPVILMIPLLPVMEGHDVTLHCLTRNTLFNLPAAFYKNGSLIRTEPTGHMAIQNVTKSDEGLYNCHISSSGESPPSSLLVRVNDSTPSALQQSPSKPFMTLVRHIVVCTPYFICTLLMVSVYQQKSSGHILPVSMTTLPHNEDDEELDPQYDDVTTEHHF